MASIFGESFRNYAKKKHQLSIGQCVWRGRDSETMCKAPLNTHTLPSRFDQPCQPTRGPAISHSIPPNPKTSKANENRKRRPTQKERDRGKRHTKNTQNFSPERFGGRIYERERGNGAVFLSFSREAWSHFLHKRAHVWSAEYFEKGRAKYFPRSKGV